MKKVRLVNCKLIKQPQILPRYAIYPGPEVVTRYAVIRPTPMPVENATYDIVCDNLQTENVELEFDSENN
ncbi:MAG: hypothetical protein HQK50_16850 [Oligoflexia bacterium]|nr:hypothetical protein [Oligoflexia bacterium]MBF0367248.1 hypothetical protein [Oligoflexia bacterium]